MPYIVIVEYRGWCSSRRNTFGTFRSERAAERFAAEVAAFDDARSEADRGEVRQIETSIHMVTPPALEFVREDVEELSEVTVVSGPPWPG